MKMSNPGIIWLALAALASASDPRINRMLACCDVIRLKLEEVESEVDIFLYETPFDKQLVIDKLAAEMLVQCFDFITEELAAQVLDQQDFELTEGLRRAVKLRTMQFGTTEELALDEREQMIYDTVIRDLPDMEEHRDSETPVDYLGVLLILAAVCTAIYCGVKRYKLQARRVWQANKRSA